MNKSNKIKIKSNKSKSSKSKSNKSKIKSKNNKSKNNKIMIKQNGGTGVIINTPDYASHIQLTMHGKDCLPNVLAALNLMTRETAEYLAYLIGNYVNTDGKLGRGTRTHEIIGMLKLAYWEWNDIKWKKVTGLGDFSYSCPKQNDCAILCICWPTNNAHALGVVRDNKNGKDPFVIIDSQRQKVYPYTEYFNLYKKYFSATYPNWNPLDNLYIVSSLQNVEDKFMITPHIVHAVIGNMPQAYMGHDEYFDRTNLSDFLLPKNPKVGDGFDTGNEYSYDEDSYDEESYQGQWYQGQWYEWYQGQWYQWYQGQWYPTGYYGGAHKQQPNISHPKSSNISHLKPPNHSHPKSSNISHLKPPNISHPPPHLSHPKPPDLELPPSENLGSTIKYELENKFPTDELYTKAHEFYTNLYKIKIGDTYTTDQYSIDCFIESMREWIAYAISKKYGFEDPTPQHDVTDLDVTKMATIIEVKASEIEKNVKDTYTENKKPTARHQFTMDEKLLTNLKDIYVREKRPRNHNNNNDRVVKKTKGNNSVPAKSSVTAKIKPNEDFSTILAKKIAIDGIDPVKDATVKDTYMRAILDARRYLNDENLPLKGDLFRLFDIMKIPKKYIYEALILYKRHFNETSPQLRADLLEIELHNISNYIKRLLEIGSKRIPITKEEFELFIKEVKISGKKLDDFKKIYNIEKPPTFNNEEELTLLQALEQASPDDGEV